MPLVGFTMIFSLDTIDRLCVNFLIYTAWLQLSLLIKSTWVMKRTHPKRLASLLCTKTSQLIYPLTFLVYGTYQWWETEREFSMDSDKKSNNVVYYRRCLLAFPISRCMHHEYYMVFASLYISRCTKQFH